MAIEFQRDHFENATILPMLVIIDPRRKHLLPQTGVGSAVGAGVVSSCRSALAFARSFGLAVSIIRDGERTTPNDPQIGAWIRGLEPLRPDVLLERRGRSCYSSEFFEEVAQAAGGEIALAGFAGDGGVLATAVDAHAAGHRITVLQDATYDRASQLFSERHLRALRDFTKLDVRLTTVGTWMASINGAFAWRSRCA